MSCGHVKLLRILAQNPCPSPLQPSGQTEGKSNHAFVWAQDSTRKSEEILWLLCHQPICCCLPLLRTFARVNAAAKSRSALNWQRGLRGNKSQPRKSYCFLVFYLRGCYFSSVTAPAPPATFGDYCCKVSWQLAGLLLGHRQDTETPPLCRWWAAKRNKAPARRSLVKINSWTEGQTDSQLGHSSSASASQFLSLSVFQSLSFSVVQFCSFAAPAATSQPCSS